MGLNSSKYMNTEGATPSDEQIAVDGMRALLRTCGEGEREGLVETPFRFLKAMKELTAGYHVDPKSYLHKNFALNDSEGGAVTCYDELIISRDLPFVSLCEHHMLPFHGIAHIGYIPNTKNEQSRVVGLSKLARLLDGYAKRFQVQERLTRQIGDAIQEVLQPAGVGVIVKGHHTCQCFRGVTKAGSMVTSAMYGVLKEHPETRNEFLRLLSI